MSNSINFHDDDIAKYECRPSKFQKLTRFLYNPYDKTYIGRTSSSWGKILIFYFIFYVSLSAYFMSMITIFLRGVIEDEIPTRTGLDSVLKLQPGLSMRPIPEYSETLIKFIPYEPQSYQRYIMDMKAFITPYNEMTKKESKEFAICNDTHKIPDDIYKPCRYDLSRLGPCSTENNFGYSTGKPCVFLKLNKIFGWIPDPIDNTSALVTCEGQNYIDKTNMGKVTYYPSSNERGYFDHNYFPYVAQKGYLSPIVAIQFENAAKRRLIMVKCKVDNVKYDSNIMLFELMIDEI